MRPSRAKICRAVVAAGIVAVLVPVAGAQVATLGKGHQLLVNNGLQIWGLDQGAVGFNYNNLANANFNGVLWSFGIDTDNSKLATLTSGQKWGKWVDASGTPAAALDAYETTRIADLVALQVGDEQQSDLENPNGVTKAWFQAAHAGNHFSNQLLYVNSFFIGSDAAYGQFISSANPDAISFDSYPFDEPYGSIIFPHNWLSKAGQFRRHALSSYLGIGGNAPRPYGMYLQTYESTSEGTRHPGEVEMRWQQFTAWTMGFTFVDAFTVGGSSSLFSGSNMSSPTEPRFSQFAETSRQSLNLGPALTRLISYGYGPSIVVGKDAAGTPNIVPSDWLVFNKSNAPPAQQYLSTVSATNTGTKNNGQPGDVYVGFFNSLHESFGNPAGTAYFMVTNALGPYLNDPTATVADTQQQITLDFDMGATTINSLQRLRRSDGQVEVVPLTHIGGTTWRLAFNLEGGTGDLFKYNDGHTFVGVQEVQQTTYWDSDASAAGNSTATGAGLGGMGNWDGGAKWFNGATNAPWAVNENAIFWGTAGTVTLTAPRSVDSLAFKTSGYTLAGSTLTLNRPFVTVNSGVTATISSTVAGAIGLTKSGAGTLQLTGSNAYSGGTTIDEGIVQVNSDAALGAAPATLQTNIALDGGTLQWGANFDLNNNRAIALGPGGGTIDTQNFSNPAGYNATAGGFRGPGDLTKLGSGTFFAAATTGGANTTWKGRLIIKEGTWKIVASDGLPYNVPLADGLKADQVTLDGGTWQIGATINVTNARRGITVASGGGTIDTQANNFTWAGPLAGADTSAVLNKVGSGTLTFTGVGTASTYSGIVNVDAGTLRLNNANSMGPLTAINLANTAGVALNLSGSVTIGSLSGGGLSGGNVASISPVGIVITTGVNNSSTTFAGVISGAAAALTKTGTGTMTLTSFNTYTGLTTVAGGTLVVNGSIAGNAVVQSGATLGGTGTVHGSTSVQNGGTLSPGNSPGTLTTNALTMSSLATLEMEIGPTSDRVNVSGTATLAGTLEVSLVDDFTPALGQTFTLLAAGTRNGTFGTETLPTISNLTFDVTYDSQNVYAQVVPLLLGDFNTDGTVDAGDYITWRKAYTATFPNGYDQWRTHYGESLPSGEVSTATPEPTTGLLLLVSFAAAHATSPRSRIRRGGLRRGFR